MRPEKYLDNPTYIDEQVKGYQRYHGQLLHANNALSVLDPCNAASCLVSYPEDRTAAVSTYNMKLSTTTPAYIPGHG